MPLKKRGGFTLVEIVVVIAVLAVISIPLGRALYDVIQRIAFNEEIMEDQYNGRMALLNMSRDIHHSDGLGNVFIGSEDGGTNNVLRVYTPNVTAADQFESVYCLGDDNLLTRTVTSIPAGKENPVAFPPVEIAGISYDWVKINAGKIVPLVPDKEYLDTERGGQATNRFLQISITCLDGGEFSTVLSVSRIPE